MDRKSSAGMFKTVHLAVDWRHSKSPPCGRSTVEWLRSAQETHPAVNIREEFEKCKPRRTVVCVTAPTEVEVPRRLSSHRREALPVETVFQDWGLTARASGRLAASASRQSGRARALAQATPRGGRPPAVRPSDYRARRLNSATRSCSPPGRFRSGPIALAHSPALRTARADGSPAFPPAQPASAR
jgi:hypothetical protein